MRRALVLGMLVAAAGCASQSPREQAMESPAAYENAVRATTSDPATVERAVATADQLRAILDDWNEEQRLLAEERWDLFSDYNTTRDGFNAYYRTALERREQTWGQLIDVAMEARDSMTVDEWFGMYEKLNK